MMKHIQKNGFTLVETLIAVTILLVSVSAPLTIASQGLSSAYFARDQITAFYLAQDAVEFVRNYRDGNFLAEASWLTGFPDTTGAMFTVDTIDESISLCPGGNCEPLDYNSSSGFYKYNDPQGDQSRFTRSVSITALSADEAEVAVTVSWNTGIFNRSFTVEENIFNWKQ